MWHTQGCVFHIAGFLAENSAQEAFFRSKLFFTFWSDLANENIIWTDFCTNANDAILIEVFNRVLTYIRNVTRDLFRSKFCIARFHFIFFKMDGCKAIFLDKPFRKQNRIFKVATFPRKEGYTHVLTQSYLTAIVVSHTGNHTA